MDEVVDISTGTNSNKEKNRIDIISIIKKSSSNTSMVNHTDEKEVPCVKNNNHSKVAHDIPTANTLSSTHTKQLDKEHQNSSISVKNKVKVKKENNIAIDQLKTRDFIVDKVEKKIKKKADDKYH